MAVPFPLSFLGKSLFLLWISLSTIAFVRALAICSSPSINHRTSESLFSIRQEFIGRNSRPNILYAATTENDQNLSSAVAVASSSAIGNDDDDDDDHDHDDDENKEDYGVGDDNHDETILDLSATTNKSRRSFRRRVKRLTKKIVPWTIQQLPQTLQGTEQTEIPQTPIVSTKAINIQTQELIEDAFRPAEESIRQLEESLVVARAALANAKMESYKAIAEAMEVSSPISDALNGSSSSNNKSSSSSTTSPTDNNVDYDLDSLTFEDVDYESSEMAPPFLDQDSCLMPDAEPLVRVEKAPDNSRRIFAGIDILASADDVWNVLTNYQELQNVIPNLVVNDILDLYDGSESSNTFDDEDLPEEIRCANLSRTMKGSLLRQVGGAKVAGINFSAKTTLEVREWPNGMPDFAHFMDDMWEGKSREERAKEYPRIRLKRYRFPRPFAVSNLPTRDISMQSIANDDGEFRLYQGVWRMQPLVGCSPPGKDAMRLTYAVEISPRVYLPVKLIEGRIVRDLCSNLEAIREAVSGNE